MQPKRPWHTRCISSYPNQGASAAAFDVIVADSQVTGARGQWSNERYRIHCNPWSQIKKLMNPMHMLSEHVAPTSHRPMRSALIARLAFLAIALPLAGCGGGESGSAPVVTAQPASITVAEQQSVSFSVDATGTAPLSYVWRRNGTPIVGATSATLTLSAALAADHGARFSAVVTNTAGSVTSAEAVLTEELPMFLLAGQSNMEGNVDATLFQSLLADLASAANTDINARLAERIRFWHKDTNNGYAGYGYSPQMAALEASEVVRLNAAGLVGADLTVPNTKVLCSWNSAVPSPLFVSSLPTHCGNAYGPELVFGQALNKAGYSSTSLIKVAHGGTNLYVDWRSPLSGGTVGPLYAELRARIQSLKAVPASVNPSCTTRGCRWAAFVWFQGENDSFDSANGLAYEQNLKNLIADVRNDVGSPTLPVVIVQTGSWAQSLTFGKNVAAAQSAVVGADKYARLVNTSDLSGFYHYDSASKLIIGERVAQAVKSLMAAAPVAK
jgi:Carbohydrate esterase, sialic acid-specific acetylesterase